MLKAALFRHDGVPGNVLHLAHNGLSIKVHELHAGGSYYCQVTIVQKKQVTRVIEDGGNIGSYKIFVVAQADNRRRAIAGCNDLIGLFHGDYSQSKNSSK